MPDARWRFYCSVFLWIAENIATLFGAWQYPNQHGGWHLVHLAKMSSSSLLVIFSFLIVAREYRISVGNAAGQIARE